MATTPQTDPPKAAPGQPGPLTRREKLLLRLERLPRGEPLAWGVIGESRVEGSIIL